MPCCSSTSLLLSLLLSVWAIAPTGSSLAAESPPGTAPVRQKPVPVFHSTARIALEAATTENSPVLLAFFGNTEESTRLRENVLHSTEFKEQGGSLQITEINASADPAAARAFGVRRLPALVLVTAEEKIVARHEGYFHTAELMLWLREARQRLAEGEWEGTLPGGKAAAFATRAATGRLEPADLPGLVQLLGEPDPADRAAAAELISGLRDQAVPTLIQAVTNQYLGIRIAASELLHDLAPGAPTVDPWLAPGELSRTAGSLQEWWDKARRLPPSATIKPDPAALQSIQGALESLRSTEPLARTEALALLVRNGRSALPALREAIRACEKNSDHRTLTLLEDARWAILVSDTLEKQAGGVRYALARGKTQERQNAAMRLGRAGRPALDALAELTNDPDPMVVESSVRALSAVGGADAIPAMAALLKASDSNLRMTAAQALGKTKKPEAIAPLLPVTEDLNEVVACAALAALEEINAGRNYSDRKQQDPESVQAVKKALADPRWRVRATAAEMAGKMELSQLTADLKPLINDPDGFVVKSALESLTKFNAAPEPEQLLEVARRLPGLRPQAIQQLVVMSSAPAVKAVTELYAAGPIETRQSILQSIGLTGIRQSGQSASAASAWKPLLTSAVAEPEPALRRLAASVLASQDPSVVVTLVSGLLSDQDATVRGAAARTLILLVGGEKEAPDPGNSSMAMEIAAMQDQLESGLDMDFNLSGLGNSSRPVKTNQPAFSAADLAHWHGTLQERAGSAPDPLIATALFVTATNAPLALTALDSSLARATPVMLETLAQGRVAAVLIPRIPWPEGRAVIERFTSSPTLYLKCLSQLALVKPGLREYWLAPQRFVALLDRAPADQAMSAVEGLLTPRGKNWTLLSGSPETVPLLEGLTRATNALWRAVGIYGLARLEEPQYLPIFRQALADTNAWVRYHAINAIGNVSTNTAEVERAAIGLLGDRDSRAASAAVTWLLPPETRLALGYSDHGYFLFEGIHAGGYFAVASSDQSRPLAAITPAPDFVAEVRKRASSADAESLGLYSVVLAQYGDNSGLDRLLPQLPDGQDADQWRSTVLTAIALARDPRYLPQVRRFATAAVEQWDLQRILQAIRSMPGPEARALRLEINRRLRSGKEGQL